MHRLHHSTQWIHVHMAAGDGAAVLHLQGVYSMVDSHEANSQLMDPVLQHSARLGKAPHMVVRGMSMPCCGTCCAFLGSQPLR